MVLYNSYQDAVISSVETFIAAIFSLYYASISDTGNSIAAISPPSSVLAKVPDKLAPSSALAIAVKP
jgi:hypothetical protein